jgi:LruC domain-containing protein
LLCFPTTFLAAQRVFSLCFPQKNVDYYTCIYAVVTKILGLSIRIGVGMKSAFHRLRSSGILVVCFLLIALIQVRATVVPTVDSGQVGTVVVPLPEIVEAVLVPTGLRLRGENFGSGDAEVWLEYVRGPITGTVQAKVAALVVGQDAAEAGKALDEILVELPAVAEESVSFSAVILKVATGMVRRSLIAKKATGTIQKASAGLVSTETVALGPSAAGAKPTVVEVSTTLKREETASEGIESVTVPAGFDFSTTRTILVTRQLLSTLGNPMGGVSFDVYADEPVESDDPAEPGKVGDKLATVRTDANGNYTVVLTIPSTLTRLYLDIEAIGVATGQWLELETVVSEGQAVAVVGGWNLLSIPSGIVNPTVDNMYGGEGAVAFGWSGKSYYRVKDELLSDVCGYWVWQANPGICQVGAGVLQSDWAFSQLPVLVPGWNLISVPSGVANKTATELFGDQISGPVWDWNGTTYVDASQTKLSALKGYWAYCPSATPSRATRTESLPDNMTVMGEYDSLGVPDYLEDEPDVVDADLLADLRTWFPEREVTAFHASYLEELRVTDIQLKEEADVWITFIHEGAAWTSALGYYTYPLDSLPASPAQVENFKIAFPNFSYKNAPGLGGMETGDKIRLGHFPAGTGIGFFMLSQGFDKDSGTLVPGLYTLYSTSAWNPESDPALQQHNVLLKDTSRELLFLGFEDLKREWPSCDNDFNDALASLTVVPFSAVDLTNVATVGGVPDSDGDGVPDQDDQFPEDFKRAYNNYFPSEDGFGTLAFEDLWPRKGDYDFNDLVVEYHFNYITNADSQVVDVKGTFRFMAVGGTYHDGFAFELPISADNVKSVSGSRFFNEPDLDPTVPLPMVIALNANGTESGQSNAVIMVTNDAISLMGVEPDKYNFFNTVNGSDYVNPVEVAVEVTLDTPAEISVIGLPPYNPFVIVDRDRGTEIHLPGKTPTDLAETSRFGTGADASDPSAGVYYVSDMGLPWALNFPAAWCYPFEYVDITKAYLKFRNWAESGGSEYGDWYQDVVDYRDETKIYKHSVAPVR